MTWIGIYTKGYNKVNNKIDIHVTKFTKSTGYQSKWVKKYEILTLVTLTKKKKFDVLH